MDYNLTVKLPGDVSDRLKLPGIGEQLVDLLKDKDGRINLNFLVTGMTNEPVLKLNMSAEDLVKKAAEQKGNEGKQKLEDELKKKAEEGLKKLFKKP